MDYKKTLLYVSGLFLAVGGPITVFSGAEFLNSKKPPDATSAATVADEPLSAPSSGQPLLGKTASRFSRSRAAAPQAALPATLPTLDEVLRFEATVEWIIHRWPRITTGLSYLQLQGYRVTLMTGASLPDVAGSLTYYFNAQQKVQRITLTGTTGDPSRLVNIVTRRHNFTRRLVNEPGIVLYEAVDSNNRPVGTLKIRSAKVILASQPYTRYEVDLVMDRSE